MWFAVKSGLSLAAFAILAVGLVAVLHEITRERIRTNERSLALQRLATLVPGYDLDTLIFDLDTLDTQPQTLCDDTHRNLLSLRPVVAQGYGGPIKLLLGTDSSGRITGVIVLQHQETPGIGDVIDRRRSRWLDRFRGLSRRSLKAHQGQDEGIDSVTGATITTRSVIAAVRAELQHPNATTACGSAP